MSRLYSVQCTQTHKHTVESRAAFCLSRISNFNICFVNVSFVKILEFSYCFSCLKDLSGAKSVFWSQVKSCFHSCKGVRLPTNILTRDGLQNWIFFRLVPAHLLLLHLLADWLAKDCLLTGQEQACSRITQLFVRLFDCSSPCRK